MATLSDIKVGVVSNNIHYNNWNSLLQEYIMLGRVSNGPMLAATSRRIVYICILFGYTEVYYSQYYHIIIYKSLKLNNS